MGSSPPPQSWDPERYARNARFVADLGTPVVELLAPRPGERILDLGCGDGVLTAKLVALGCDVVGVDASAPLVEAARRLGLDARVCDGEALAFAGEFDAVFSNAALHWMRGADRVIDGTWRALRPGGRFVGEFGGAGNVATIHRALLAALERRGVDGRGLDPWYYPSVEDYRGRLERRGFVVESIALVPRPTPLPGDLDGWLETFAESFTRAVPAAEHPALFAEVRAECAPRLVGPDGRWSADYVRLRFRARKPDGAT
jgi:SAM-dependent methyltransferase